MEKVSTRLANTGIISRAHEGEMKRGKISIIKLEHGKKQNLTNLDHIIRSSLSNDAQQKQVTFRKPAFKIKGNISYRKK